MIEAEGQGVETTVRLVLAHAEDQLMSAELTKTMVEEMIALYKRIDALEEALEQKSSKEENRQPFRSGKNKEEFCMKKIVLMCSNGMSTSLMVAKMRRPPPRQAMNAPSTPILWQPPRKWAPMLTAS